MLYLTIILTFAIGYRLGRRAEAKHRTKFWTALQATGRTTNNGKQQ